MIIDFHTHVFSPQVKKNRGGYIDSDPCFAILYSDKDAELATADDLIAGMDEDGVDVSVILNIGWATHDMCVESNDYILESVARYPKRLIGFCAVQPLSIEAAVNEIERCAKGGAKGIGELRPDVQMLDPDEGEIIDPLVEAVRKHKLITLFHASEPVGHQYPGKGAVTPDVLYPLIQRFAGLPVVCAHWGGGLPFYALMPEVKKAMADVYFDTAASPYLYSPQIYDQVAQLAGGDRILFGSDYPLIKPSRYIKEMDSAELSQETREMILSGNARRLLGMDGKG